MNRKISDILLTLLAPILWGTTYLVTTELLPMHKPLTAALIRTLPAGLVLILIIRKSPVKNEFSWLKILCLSFLNITFFQVLLFVSAYRLPGGIAAIVGSVQPLIIMMLMFFIDNIRPSLKVVIASSTTILGLSFLLLKPDAQWDIVGLLSALFGSIAMACGIFLTKRWQPNISVINFTGWQLFLGGLMLLPVTFYFESIPEEMTINHVIGYTYLAFFGSFIAYSLWFRGITKLPTVAVSILGAFSPITATLLGWIYLNQSLSIAQFWGLIIVLISIVIVQQTKPSNN